VAETDYCYRGSEFSWSCWILSSVCSEFFFNCKANEEADDEGCPLFGLRIVRRAFIL
jgi:hypothetical protein